jgi:hypothetical protein
MSKPTFEEALQVVKLELVSTAYCSEKVGNEFWNGAAHAVGVVLTRLDSLYRTGSCGLTSQMAKHWKKDEAPNAKWDDEDWKLHPQGERPKKESGDES